jgi:hypothetical protein
LRERNILPIDLPPKVPNEKRIKKMLAYKAKFGILTFLSFDMDPIVINQKSEIKNPQSDPNPIPAAAQSDTRFQSSRSECVAVVGIRSW